MEKKNRELERERKRVHIRISNHITADSFIHGDTVFIRRVTTTSTLFRAQQYARTRVCMCVYAVEKKPRLIPDARSKRCIEIPRVLRSVCSAWIFIRPIVCARHSVNTWNSTASAIVNFTEAAPIYLAHIYVFRVLHFLQRAQIPQAIFYLRVVQGDSIFVNAQLYSEIPRDRIARNSFFLSTKLSEALIVFEFSKATENKISLVNDLTKIISFIIHITIRN